MCVIMYLWKYGFYLPLFIQSIYFLLLPIITSFNFLEGRLLLSDRGLSSLMITFGCASGVCLVLEDGNNDRRQ